MGWHVEEARPSLNFSGERGIGPIESHAFGTLEAEGSNAQVVGVVNSGEEG